MLLARICYEHLQWCRIAKSLSQITFDLVLRRQIDLLEQLWRDRDASRSLNALQRLHWLHIAMQMSAIGVSCIMIVSAYIRA